MIINEDRIFEHLPLMNHIVGETMTRVPRHVDRDDLTSAGLGALVVAARAFDESRGVPFERYAATRIRGAILDELRSADWASRSVRRRARDLAETRSRLATTLGRTPTSAEVARAAGLSEREVAANEHDAERAHVFSLQAGEAAVEDLIAHRAPSPEELVERKERLTYLAEGIAELPERLRVVVRDYYLRERPMAGIAADLGVSESRVSQMRSEALELLRAALGHVFETEQPHRSAGKAGVAQRRRDAYVSAVVTRHARAGSRPERAEAA